MIQNLYEQNSQELFVDFSYFINLLFFISIPIQSSLDINLYHLLNYLIFLVSNLKFCITLPFFILSTILLFVFRFFPIFLIYISIYYRNLNDFIVPNFYYQNHFTKLLIIHNYLIFDGLYYLLKMQNLYESNLNRFMFLFFIKLFFLFMVLFLINYCFHKYQLPLNMPEPGLSYHLLDLIISYCSNLMFTTSTMSQTRFVLIKESFL